MMVKGIPSLSWSYLFSPYLHLPYLYLYLLSEGYLLYQRAGRAGKVGLTQVEVEMRTILSPSSSLNNRWQLFEVEVKVWTIHDNDFKSKLKFEQINENDFKSELNNRWEWFEVEVKVWTNDLYD